MKSDVFYFKQGRFTPPQPFVPPVDDRSSRQRSNQRPPPSTHADPHARLVADKHDAPRSRQTSPYHNRNPSPARAPSVASFEESPSVPSNAPLLAPRPQPLAVAIHEPPRLVKQSSSGESSSGGSSIQVRQVQESRKHRSIPPPQPIPVPGAPEYSQPGPPPLPLPHQMHDGLVMSHESAASYSRPSQQASAYSRQPFFPSPYHTSPHPSQMNNQLYSSAVHGLRMTAPGAQVEPQGPRDFANPNHFPSPFRYRPKVLSVPTPLAPQMPSSNAASVMMMSPPYQAQATAPPAPLHPSTIPYQGHWTPFTSEPPPPSQLHQQMQKQKQVRPLPLPPRQQHHQQQQGRQTGHQYSISEPPMIVFPSPSPDDSLPSTQDGYYTDARRANAEMQANSSSGRGMQSSSFVPPPAQARLSPPSQRGHTKSMSEMGPAKMNASTIARMLQAQRGNSANASSTSLNRLSANASSTSLNELPTNESSTSLVQQAQAHHQSQPLVPEVRTKTHRSDSPVRLVPPADQAPRSPAPPYTEAQPSSQLRVLRRETPPPPPPQAASAPILIRSNSPAGSGPSLGQVHSRRFASSDALLEGNNGGNNSSSSDVSTNTPTPAARKISFDVPHGPEQDPPAAAAAPKKRRQRGRPTNPEDNMLVDPFGFTISEDTRYDVIEKVTAGVSIYSRFSLSFGSRVES